MLKNLPLSAAVLAVALAVVPNTAHAFKSCFAHYDADGKKLEDVPFIIDGMQATENGYVLVRWGKTLDGKDNWHVLTRSGDPGYEALVSVATSAMLSGTPVVVHVNGDTCDQDTAYENKIKRISMMRPTAPHN